VCIAEKRKSSGLSRGKAIGVSGFCWNCDAIGVSKWSRRSRGWSRGHDLCHGESGSGASLGASIAVLGSHSLRTMSDRMPSGVQRWGECSEATVVC